MNKRITLLGLLMCFAVFSIKAQVSVTSISQTYTQDFNSLASTGSTSSLLPTGWNVSRNSYTIGNGSANSGSVYSYGITSSTDRALGTLPSGSYNPVLLGCKFVNNTGGEITGLNISYMGEMWRLGANGSPLDTLYFQYTTENVDSIFNGNWTDVASLHFITPDSTGALNARDGNATNNQTFISSSVTGLSIANGATFWIRWQDKNSLGSDDGLSVDSLKVTFSNVVLPACTEPANSVTNVVLNATSTTAVSGSFTGTSADGYLVVLDSNATAPAITDATVYTVGQTVGSGTATVISVGTSTSFSRSGLVPNTVYKVHVFPYNSASCSAGPNYKISAPGNDTAKTLVDACPEPTAKPTNLQFTLVNDNNINGKFNKAVPAPTGGYVVVYSTSSSVGYPNDSTPYTVGDSIKNGSAKSKVAYVGTDSTFTVSGLTSGTKYYFAVIPFNNCVYGPNYFRTTPLRDDTTTTGGIPVCAEPDTITGITVTGTTDNSITATFTPHSGGADGYLVVFRKSSSFLVGVNDATTYTVGQLLTQTSGSFIDSSFVGYIGTNTTFTLTGLTLGTTYHFAVFPFNNTACSGGPNYKVKFTNNVNKTSATTTGGACVEPNAVPQNLVFNNVTTSSISGHFKQQTIADGYVVVVAKGFIANLRDSVVYSVGDSVGNSPKTYIAKVATSNLDTNFTINGLSANTSYSVAIYSYKVCNGFRLYKSQIVPNVNKRDTITALGTGVKYNNPEAEFSLFPNPTNTGSLFVKFNTTLKDDATVEVVDILGRKLVVQKLTTGNDVHTVDVSELAKGTYILNVVYKGTNNVSTFIVE
jgi:hypothetical protein